MRIRILLAFVLFTTLCIAQKSKGDRLIAWQVDMAENANYDSAVAYAQIGCMESLHIFFTWSGIEPNNGNFDQSYINQTLDIANIYYPAFGIQTELQLATMNTNQIEVPTDLKSVKFDDPIMINRFKTLLDTLFTHIPDMELTALNIGNESDAFMRNDSVKYKAYATFLDSVIPYAKSLYFNLHSKELKVGTTFTFDGLTDVNRSVYCKMVNANRDLVSVTYYPLDVDFTMEDPSVVGPDFGKLVNIYSDTSQPIYFVECGYSSSIVCNSSEAAQAEFYVNVFNAWDQYSDNIKYITIFKSTDWSLAEVQSLALYYGINDTIFLEYLRTLGVRTWEKNGSNKLAYETILCELDKRDWCETNCLWSGVDNIQNAADVIVFPNPSSGGLKINLGKIYNDVEIIIFNAQGMVVTKQYFGSTSIFNTNIDGPNGIYIVQIINANGILATIKVALE